MDIHLETKVDGHKYKGITYISVDSVITWLLKSALKNESPNIQTAYQMAAEVLENWKNKDTKTLSDYEIGYQDGKGDATL